MTYYDEIKNKLIDNEIYERVKDYSKERNRVITYYEVGRLLYEAGSKYGENIIGKYAEKLVNEVGKKYNRSTLFRIKKFYVIFSNKKVATAWQHLNWSQCKKLLPIENIDKINYYIDICINQNLAVRELEHKIKNKEYERLDEDTKNKLISNENTDITDYIKNPILIKNNLNYLDISEKVLKRLILEDLDNFLKELGEGYTYIGNEYKIKIGDRYNYIDLLLFNINYNCYVVIELKVTELKKEYIGQIITYKNYIDSTIRKDKNETIGIIISKKDNKYIMSYCTDNRIISREYIVY
ncbi:MAG: DUF1016 family protein [Bacilli bacterium]|nr:DUF1016 family protein [Bacilli bacterium]